MLPRNNELPDEQDNRLCEYSNTCLQMLQHGLGVGVLGSEFATRPERLSDSSQVTSVSNSLYWRSPTQWLLMAEVFSLKSQEEGERPAPSAELTGHW